MNLHPISETHQFRPTLTYLDILSHRNRRSHQGGSDFESDGGPPPDPDEPVPTEVTRKEKATESGREVQVSARKSDDKGGASALGGLSAVRRDLLRTIRAEEDEEWADLLFFDVTVRVPALFSLDFFNTQMRIRRMSLQKHSRQSSPKARTCLQLMTT